MNTSSRLTLLLLLWLTLFAPVFPELFSSWLGHSNNSHGLLVPLVSGYLVWQKRTELAESELSVSWRGAILLAACIAFYLVAIAGGIALFMRLAMVGALVGLCLFVLGTSTFRLLLFPLLFLLFMIPVPDSVVGRVSFPLQLMATALSARLIELFSIPVYREGNMLYFVQTQLEVAEACSGLRSLEALGMLSVLFAHLLNQSRGRKWLLALSAVPIAMLANIFRVSGTGILAHFYGDQIARGFLHTFSGLAVFMFGLVVLGGVYRLLDRPAPLQGEV